MATLDSLGFEIERAPRIFHRDTTMPDNSQLGFVGDPNTAIDGNTPGDTLLFYAPSGTRYIDKQTTPYDIWEKREDSPGGIWLDSSVGSSTIIKKPIAVVFSTDSAKFRYRYLDFAGRPSNLLGFPVFEDSNLSRVRVNTMDFCSGDIQILISDTLIYTLTMNNSKTENVNNINIPVKEGDFLQAYAESIDGLIYPIVQVFLT